MTERAVDLDLLTKPFPKTAIKQRQAGGGRSLDYVEGHTVIHRLNEATGNRWDMEVRDITSKDLGANTLMIARVALTLPGLGTREGLGVQMVHERGGEDLVKGCITDALKKAATLFGVGLELYGPDYEAGEVSGPAPDTRTQLRQPPRPAPQQTTQVATNGPARRAPATDGPLPITDGQRKAIFAIGKKRWGDAYDQEVHAYLLARWEKGSVNELSIQEASTTIDELQQATAGGGR